MELGNLLFGNSRGRYAVDRDVGWGEIFHRLCKKINPTTQGYGETFENDTFSMMQYYWGDECTCGFDLVDSGHKRLRKLKHKTACYRTRLSEMTKQFLAEQKVSSYYDLTKRLRNKHDKQVKQLCEELSLTYPQGSLVHCTCDFDVRWEKVLDQYQVEYGMKSCKPTCMLEAPNFLHKPTGFTISWYKYPFRDSYMNQQITTKQFTSIIKDCISSLDKEGVSSNEKQKGK